MFGRRRNPLLATAVVVGASRSAARREVGKQSNNQAQYEQDVQREAERREREEKEQEVQTQRAVDEALRRAGVGGYVVDQQSGSASSPGPSSSPPTPMSLGAEGVSQYCPACGSVCKMDDMFCRRCGRKQDRG